MLHATLLEDVDRGAKAYREEAFGPVAILSKFTDWEAALAEVNDSKFGLQAGLFTRDLHKVLEAWDHLDVGGIVVNDVSSYRVDNMPYGGVKDRGPGREGIRMPMEDMSETRNLVLWPASSSLRRTRWDRDRLGKIRGAAGGERAWRYR